MRDPIAIITERALAPVTQGHTGDPAAKGRGASGRSIKQPQYVTWSGAVATVHKRLIIGLTGYGFGSELS
jgi:hypothetical protein